MSNHVLALAGGVGGAKLALGLSRILPPDQLTIVVNTGDDDVFHGLHVSPDLDTVMYTLAGLSNREQGWGLEGETFSAMDRLEVLGGETWFRLGDRDLATHLRRTQLLRQGFTLAQATSELCARLGVAVRITPMTNAPVRTQVETEDGVLPFQEYFVHRRCEPRVRSIRFKGAGTAEPAPSFSDALDRATIIVFCPSNPFVSIDPILAIPGIRRRIENAGAARIAVTPIIGGRAVKGPVGKMLTELGHDSSSTAVATHYRGLCDIFALDEADAAAAPEIEALGMRAVVAATLMLDDASKIALARRVLDVARPDAVNAR